VEVLDAGRDDEVEALRAARSIVAVGQGVAPDEYGELDALLKVLGAEMGATRKVTDKGWLPRSRQIGITGHSVAPALYVAIGVSGKFNHIVGARGAGTVVAINNDPDARIFEWADVGIVADWHEVVPLLVDALG
jgi:electron transfer flavoprotein alpha subunit